MISMPILYIINSLLDVNPLISIVDNDYIVLKWLLYYMIPGQWKLNTPFIKRQKKAT